jgi:hypothetical protein
VRARRFSANPTEIPDPFLLKVKRDFELFGSGACESRVSGFEIALPGENAGYRGFSPRKHGECFKNECQTRG